MCDPSEGRQPTAPAEGGRGRREEGSTRPAADPILRRPDTFARRRIYDIETLQLKYTLFLICFLQIILAVW